MYCQECGNELEAGDLFCKSCGTKIEKEKKVQIPEYQKSRLNNDKFPPQIVDAKITKLDEINFPYESPIRLCLLQLVTFGIYYFILLYRWVKVINSASKKDLINPKLAILLSIITLGAASIYFDYQIVVRSEKILKSTNGSSNSKRRDISPPFKNLKELVLLGGIFCFIMQLFSPIFALGILLINLFIQKHLEYTFYSKNYKTKDPYQNHEETDETNKEEKIFSKKSINSVTDTDNSKQNKNGIIYRISRIGDADGLGEFKLSKFFGGFRRKYSEEEFVKNIFIGTNETTPAIKDISTAYPQPWIFLRLTFVALLIFYAFKFTYDQTGNEIYIPALIIVGSFGIPLSTLVLFLELNIRRNIPIWIIAKLFFAGAVLSLFFNEGIVGIFAVGIYQLAGASAAAITEEPAKILALLLLVRGKVKYPYILNGLLLGAAVGCGFAAFESAGYAYKAETYDQLINTITVRGILSPFMHIVWTAVGGAALWRVARGSAFSLKFLNKKAFYAPFLTVIICHAIWNSPFQLPFYGTLIICGLISWVLVLSLVNLGMKQIADEKAGKKIFNM